MPTLTTVSSLIIVEARVATTHPVPKYPGFEFAPSLLHDMAKRLRSGDLPMVFNHDVSKPVAATVIDAQVVPLDDGHFAVDAKFEVEESEWLPIQNQFDAAGVPGGFSFTGRTTDVRARPDRVGDVTLAVDAAGWTDQQREAARALLDEVTPTDSALLFQLSAAADVAAVFLELGSQVSMNMLGSAAYEAVKGLVQARAPKQTRLEVHRTAPNGHRFTAIVETEDSAVAIAALQTLPESQSQQVIVFDDDSWNWPNREA